MNRIAKILKVFLLLFDSSQVILKSRFTSTEQQKQRRQWECALSEGGRGPLHKHKQKYVESTLVMNLLYTFWVITSIWFLLPCSRWTYLPPLYPCRMRLLAYLFIPFYSFQRLSHIPHSLHWISTVNFHILPYIYHV